MGVRALWVRFGGKRAKSEGKFEMVKEMEFDKSVKNNTQTGCYLIKAT